MGHLQEDRRVDSLNLFELFARQQHPVTLARTGSSIQLTIMSLAVIINVFIAGFLFGRRSDTGDQMAGAG
jgi:hypothetical protein